MIKAPLVPCQVFRCFSDGSPTEIVADLLSTEEPLEIILQQDALDGYWERSLSVTMRTPGADFDFVKGFLFTEGIITNVEQILHVRYCTQVENEQQENTVKVLLSKDLVVDWQQISRLFFVSSSCGVCGKQSIQAAMQTHCKATYMPSPVLSKEIIFALPEKLASFQRQFAHTGGLHASAFFDLKGDLLAIREDVGRHNALDKLIGSQLAQIVANPSFDPILLLSGRASFELIQKASAAGIRYIVSIGAPSSLAVELANNLQVFLAGFLRNTHFNVYSGASWLK